MSTPPAITIVQPNPDGSLPIPAPSAPSATEAAAAQLQQRAEALQEQLDGLQELLAKPLNEILADRDKALEAAANWYVDLRDEALGTPLHDAHRRWLDSDPQHRMAWDRLARLHRHTLHDRHAQHAAGLVPGAGIAAGECGDTSVDTLLSNSASGRASMACVAGLA